MLLLEWLNTGNMKYARVWHKASLLADGKVLVTDRENDDGELNSVELYDPSTGNWTTTGNLTYARYIHTASVLTDGKVLVTGGENHVGTLKSTELYIHQRVVGPLLTNKMMNDNGTQHPN
jgi:hypothetical protein